MVIQSYKSLRNVFRWNYRTITSEKITQFIISEVHIINIWKVKLFIHLYPTGHGYYFLKYTFVIFILCNKYIKELWIVFFKIIYINTCTSMQLILSKLYTVFIVDYWYLEKYKRYLGLMRRKLSIPCGSRFYCYFSIVLVQTFQSSYFF